MHHFNLCLHHRLAFSLYFCVCVPFLLIRTPVVWNLGPTLIQYDIIIASYICGYPASKSGHFLKFWVDMSWGWGWGSDGTHYLIIRLCHECHLTISKNSVLKKFSTTENRWEILNGTVGVFKKWIG